MQIEEFKQIDQVIQELEQTIKKLKLDHEKEVTKLLEQNRQLIQVQQTVVQDVQRQQHQLVAAVTAAAKTATSAAPAAVPPEPAPALPPSANSSVNESGGVKGGMEIEQNNNNEKNDVNMTSSVTSSTQNNNSENFCEKISEKLVNDKQKNNDENLNQAKIENEKECKVTYPNCNGNDEDGDSLMTTTPSAGLSIKTLHILKHKSVVSCVKFTPDGTLLATGSKKMVQLFSVKTGEKVSIYTIDYDSITGVSTGRVYDPPTDYVPSPQLSSTSTEENSTAAAAAAAKSDLYIRSVCFSPDNKYLATGSEDKNIRLWNIPEKRMIRTWNGYDTIYSLEFTRDGTKIVSASGDNKARIWDVETGTLLHTLESVSPSSGLSNTSSNTNTNEGSARDGLTSVTISPDGRYIATGSLDRVVRLWDAETSILIASFEGHTDSVYSVAFSPDGKTLASGSLDKTIKLWDVTAAGSARGCKTTLNGHQNFVLSVAYSQDGKWIISGSKDRTVQFWDAQNYKQSAVLKGHSNSVISVAINPKESVFATGSGDSLAKLWSYSVKKI